MFINYFNHFVGFNLWNPALRVGDNPGIFAHFIIKSLLMRITTNTTVVGAIRNKSCFLI
jgi:hypothetical protein